MKKSRYSKPEITAIRVFTEEDIANGNLLVHSKETDQEQLGKQVDFDDSGDFSDQGGS